MLGGVKDVVLAVREQTRAVLGCIAGRAMELGRECLDIWGYKRVDELIWVKTNQLQRLIRTGRTGHWLNHSKEHCLVGVKGNPNINRCIDCDVLVAEVGYFEDLLAPSTVGPYAVLENCAKRLQSSIWSRHRWCEVCWEYS